MDTEPKLSFRMFPMKDGGYTLFCWTTQYGAFLDVTEANAERWLRNPKKLWKACAQLEASLRTHIRRCEPLLFHD